MLVYHQFSTTLPEYRHSICSDLAWSIACPAITHNDQNHQTADWKNSEWFMQQFENFKSNLYEIDRNPVRLQQHIFKYGDLRLGNYFESLIEFWLQESPDYRVLHRGLVIRDKNRTTGELDFIVERLTDNKIIHIEVAVKFYLGIKPVNQMQHWFGPGLIDRLDIKYHKLLNIQSQITQQEMTRAILQSENIHIDEKWILMKGRLFYHAVEPLPEQTNSNISPVHEQGWWMTLSEFIELHKNNHRSTPENWVILKKHQWLSSLNHIDSYLLKNEIFSYEALVSYYKQHCDDYPVCIAAIHENKEVHRGFIVSDQWPVNALSQL